MNRGTSSWRDAVLCLLVLHTLTCALPAQPPVTVTVQTKPIPEPITEDADQFQQPSQGISMLPAMIYSAAVSPDEKWIAMGTSDWTRPGDVVLFRRETPVDTFSPTSRMVRRFGSGVRDVAFSADSRYFAAAIFTNEVWVLDLSNMKTVALWKPGKEALNSLAFSPDGRWLATGSLDKTISVWNLTAPEKASDGLPLHAKLEGHTESVFTTTFTSDSRQLLSAGRDRRVIVWDVAEKKQTAAWDELPAVVEHLAISPDGETVAVGLWNGKIELRRRSDGAVLQKLDHLPRDAFTVTRVAFSPDGAQLASVATDGQLKLWNCADGSLQRTWTVDRDRAWAVQFTAAGQYLMTGGSEGVLRVWDRSTEKRMYELSDRPGLAETSVAMTAAAWSPDRQVLATAHQDNSLRVRRAAGTSFGETRDLPEVLYCLSYSSSKLQVAGAGEGSQAYLIDVDAEPTRPNNPKDNPSSKHPLPIVLKGHAGRVQHIVYAADGLTLFTVSDDGTVRHWDAFTGLPGPVRTPLQGPLRTVACSADGRWLAAAGHSGTILFWDLRTADLQPFGMMTGTWGAVHALAFTPDFKQLAISAADNTIRLWTLPANLDAASLTKLESKPARVLAGHAQPATSLVFSPSGGWLAADGPDNALCLWKTATGELKFRWPTESTAMDLAFSNRGMRIMRIGSDRRIVSAEGTYAALKPIATMNLSDGVRFLAITPDQTQAVIGTLTATVHSWDLQSGKITRGHCSEGIADGALSADGKTLATIGFSGDVALWSVSPPKVIATLKRGVPSTQSENEGTSIAVSADGTRLATGSWDGTIVVWDIPNRKEHHRLPQQELPVEGLRFSPDGKGLVSATGNWKEWQKPGVIKLWNVDTGKETATLPGPRSKMRRVAFSRDGSTLIAGGSQNEILRYDLKDGEWFQTTSLTTFGDNAVVEFVGDGSTQMVSGTSDGGVTVWSTQSRLRRDGIGHRTPKPQPVTAVAVSTDGSLIATGSSAGEVHFYLTPGAPEASIGSQLAKRRIPGVVTPIIEKKPGG